MADTFLPLQQSAVYAAAALACGPGLHEIDLGCGSALVVERGRLRLVSRGPVWEKQTGEADRRRALRRLARWPGVTLVTPEEPVWGFGLVPLVTPMHHAIWELSGDLRQRMSDNWRQGLTAALRAGVGVSPGSAVGLEALIGAESLQRRERGYRTLPDAFTRALPTGALRLWQWSDRQGLGAGMAFIVHGSSATYHLGWASAAARGTGVHAVMLTRAAEALFAEGVRWLDLGSVNTDQAPGLARFKLGTGAALKRLGATLLVLP